MAPDLDDPCGLNFRFRDFVECGRTFHRHAALYRAGEVASPLLNLPEQAETWDALRGLATDVLDPVVSRFGHIDLSYGFSGAELIRGVRRLAKVETRFPCIGPEVDQHAGHEVRGGKRICSRDGIAVDFAVAGVASGDLAAWVRAYTPFDRLYLYGDDRPIHLSWGPRPAGAAYCMIKYGGGRRVPKRWQ